VTDSGSGKIGYVVNAYPVVSETFLVNELRAMELGGVPVAIFTLSRRQDSVRHGAHDDVAAQRHGPASRSPFGWWRSVRAHAGGVAANRSGYMKVLRKDMLQPAAAALRQPGRETWRNLMTRAGLFFASVRVADQAVRAKVVHLHAHYAKEPLDVAARVRSLRRIPYSFAAHAKDLYTSPRGRLRRRLRDARFAVACHRHGEKRLQKIAEARDRDKVLRVAHGIDTEIFKMTLAGREAGLIVAVGRLTPKKGFDVLLRACGLLDAWGESFRCVIVGEGRTRDELVALIDELGLGHRVELYGQQPQERVLELYQRATVVALPARVLPGGNRDGIANVLVEAMATGVPVVSTPVGGIPELVRDGENGLLVPPDEPQALAKALQEILNDPDLAQRLGREAAAAPHVADFRKTNRSLIECFRAIAIADVAGAVERVSSDAWKAGGIADSAAACLGVQPTRIESVESAIARSIMPGLRANAWRPDLSRMVRRRLWDELYKSRRLDEIDLFEGPNGSSNGGKPLRVLDVGCGRGGLTVALRARGVSAVAIDMRRRNCRVTRFRGQRYDQDVPVCNGVGETLPLRDNSFDVVCMLEILEHVQDPLLLLKEARRVCRPGGKCLITVVNRWAHLDPHFHLWGINFIPRVLADGYIELRRRSKRSWRDNQALGDMHYFSFGKFRRFAVSVGFDVLDTECPDTPLRGAIHRLARLASLGFNTTTVVLVPR